MALLNVIQTRNTDFESTGSLLNVNQITLANAAVAANEPMRKGEFDAAIAALSFDNVVESTETTLQLYIDANGTGLAEGTLLFLPNAPARENRFVRRDPTQSDLGTIADFININEASSFIRTDLTDQYAGSDGIFIDDTNGFIGITDGTLTQAKLDATYEATLAKVGDATTYTNLGLVEDALEAQAIEQATHAKTKEYSVTWGAADGDGISTSTIDTSTDFGTKAVIVRILKDIGGGFFEHISTSTIEVASSATAVRLRTDSGSVIASTLVVEVTGVPTV